MSALLALRTDDTADLVDAAIDSGSDAGSLALEVLRRGREQSAAVAREREALCRGETRPRVVSNDYGDDDVR